MTTAIRVGPAEHKSAMVKIVEIVGRRQTFYVGALYAITILVVVVFVSRL